MSELRWIILGIGILIIAGIYFWESWKQKRNLRSRVENYPGDTTDSYADMSISPKMEKHREKNIDISAAAAALNAHLKKNRDEPEVGTDDLQTGNDGEKTAGSYEQAETAREEPTEETIIVIYVVAVGARKFFGVDIKAAMHECDLQYGDMQIFHYRGKGDEFRDRALFSVANIHEPGTFEPDSMDTMTTDGLAMFMCLPAPIGGDIAFEIMLDCAEKLADRLGGELRNEKHAELDSDGLNHLRRVASRY